MSTHEYPDRPQIAVGALVIKDNEVLLVKRKQPPGEGLWAIPGGRVELGETLQEATEREVGEETGVTVRAGNPIYTFDLIERDDAGRIRYHYIIVDLMADYVSGKPNPSDDACEARWVTSEELDGLQASQATKEVLKNIAHHGRIWEQFDHDVS
jgi:ADP-ribose pyrophosphatase